jgi:hypothetical protein
MTELPYYIVEPVPQSHETGRTDLNNEQVMTFPVVGGPYPTRQEAVNSAGEDYIVVEYRD